jgi:alkylation response protein AidB-like acyl-CoA dehydrogenase
MSFELTPEEQLMVQAVRELATSPAGRAHWRERALANAFPERLWDALAAAGFLGILVPQEYGGAGLGLGEMALLMETLGSEGMALLLMIVSTTMSTIALARHGSPEQKRRYLPGLAQGTTRFCFAITEPNAGSNSFRLETLATRDGDGYRIRGQKYFISGVEEAQHCLLVTRSTPARDVTDKRAGLSLFIVDTDAPGFTKQVQDTALNETERQWTLFFDDVRVPRASLIGEEGAGHRYLFDLLNPERVVSAAIATGLGRYVLGRAVAYTRDRKVFSVPIGAHQGLAHPMALAAAHLELAALMTRKAAWLFDHGKAGGAEANMAKMAAADAGLEACDIAIQAHGGNGFTREYEVVTYWPLLRLIKTAPVSREMILNFIGEHVLGLPRSY